ncbi:DUF2207 domain-containing protein [Microbacterium sp. 179-B 1A2 NHS]|uniref:DUF2207 domain-containing protein n=1 Tax=Microbacterium sp. 179-B 1A2 NHS TaxID=3142383 RepID=UPI0039A0EE45
MAAAALVVLMAVIAPPLAASADVDDFVFESLDVDFTLTRDASGVSRMDVVETFVAVFPDADQNRGMRRVIATEFRGQPVRPSVDTVVDGDGDEWEVETDDGDAGLEVVARSDDYLHGRQTFVFRYSLDNVVREFSDTGAELYWQVNGLDWEQPFGRVTARLNVAPELRHAVGASACYAGRSDSTVACDRIEETAAGTGPVLTVEQEQLAPHETLTFAVGFTDDTFEPLDTSYLGSVWAWIQLAALAAMIAVLGWAVAVRRTRLADAAGRPTVIAEYSPPAGIDALEAAVFLSKPAKAIPAEVLEQAVVGSIRISEGDKPRWGSAKLVAELVDPSRADGDGRMLLEGLFPSGRPGERYEFGSSDTRLSKAAQKILSSAGSALGKRGLRRSVRLGTRLVPGLLSVVLGALVLLAGIVMLDAAIDPLWPVIALVLGLMLVVAVIVVLAKSPLTAAGAELRDHLAGLRVFIEWAEADRIRTLQSPAGAERVAVDVDDPRQMLRLYEALLPYAVVFGQESEWSKRLAVLYEDNRVAGPSWYVGSGAFNAAAFSSGIGSLSAATASSSPTGGSTGGGSAGGGGGGGGGGGV